MSVSVVGSIGKCIDQPVLVSKFGATVPKLLIAGSLAKCGIETYKAPKKEKKKTFIKIFCVLAGTVSGALLATKQTLNLNSVKDTLKSQKEVVSGILTKNKNISAQARQLLQKSGSGKILTPGEIKTLSDSLPKNKTKDILNAIIPPTQCVKAKDIVKELGSLSYLGLLPVVGGIAGGIAGNAMTEKDWKKKVPNQIKEGSFQYFANIFLCNIGAAAALGGLELFARKGHAWATTNMARVIGMGAGIMATGVIGGSAIANWIGKKLINPIFETKEEKAIRKAKEKAGIKESIYSERKPELADMGLHVDDFATIGVLSGVKFIEPALPILYSLSGYRSGIGYRNSDESSNEKIKGHHHHHHH